MFKNFFCSQIGLTRKMEEALMEDQFAIAISHVRTRKKPSSNLETLLAAEYYKSKNKLVFMLDRHNKKGQDRDFPSHTEKISFLQQEEFFLWQMVPCLRRKIALPQKKILLVFCLDFTCLKTNLLFSVKNKILVWGKKNLLL